MENSSTVSYVAIGGPIDPNSDEEFNRKHKWKEYSCPHCGVPVMVAFPKKKGSLPVRTHYVCNCRLTAVLVSSPKLNYAPRFDTFPYIQPYSPYQPYQPTWIGESPNGVYYGPNTDKFHFDTVAPCAPDSKWYTTTWEINNEKK